MSEREKEGSKKKEKGGRFWRMLPAAAMAGGRNERTRWVEKSKDPTGREKRIFPRVVDGKAKGDASGNARKEGRKERKESRQASLGFVQ